MILHYLSLALARAHVRWPGYTDALFPGFPCFQISIMRHAIRRYALRATVLGFFYLGWGRSSRPFHVFPYVPASGLVHSMHSSGTFPPGALLPHTQNLADSAGGGKSRSSLKEEEVKEEEMERRGRGGGGGGGGGGEWRT